MSNVYGMAGELSMGNNVNDSITALNRDIKAANELKREKYLTNVKKLSDAYKNANPTLDKVKEGAEATADSLYTLGGGVKTAYRAVQARRGLQSAGALGMGGSSATTAPEELAFIPETPLPPASLQRVGQSVAGSTEGLRQGARSVQEGVESTAQPKGILRTTQTPEGDASLRAAEDLPDAGIARDFGGAQELGSLPTTVDAGRGLGLTGTNLEGLELPGTVPRPTRLAPPPAATTETAREAGRVAGQQAEGGEFGARIAAERAAQRARGGESLADITGFVGRETNPAARVSAGVGRQIPQTADDLMIKVGGGIGEGGEASSVVPSALPTINKSLGKVKFGGTEVRDLPSIVRGGSDAVAAAAPQTLTEMRQASEAEEAAKQVAPPVATDAGSVVKNGIGALDKGGVIASGLSKVSGALTAVNIASGGYDAISDLVNKGIQGKNIYEKRANVAGMVSGGADAAALGIRQATKSAGKSAIGEAAEEGGAEAGGEALGEAAALEEAGAAADATGVGAVVGLGLGVAGAVAGLYGAYESYRGEKKEKADAKTKLQQAQAKGAPQQAPVAQQDVASSGAEVRQSLQGIQAVS